MIAVTFSIPEDLQVFIEGQTVKNGFHSTDDYLRNLLDRERERERE
jgi:antitoxin ParD1/3/4